MLQPLQLWGVGVALSSSGGADELLKMTVGDWRLGATEDAEGEAPVSFLVPALIALSALVVGWWRLSLLVGSFT